MAINLSLPTRLLLDQTVMPSWKLMYAILDYMSNENGEVHYNRKKFQELLSYNDGTNIRSLSEEDIEKVISFLEESGYISVDKSTIYMYSNVVARPKPTKKEKTISQDAIDIVKYHSDSAIIRGYRSKPNNSKADLVVIQRQLDKGHTKEELIGFINHHFERDYIKKNPNYHKIMTAFRVDAFQREFPDAQERPELQNMVITEMGLGYPAGKEEESTGKWM